MNNLQWERTDGDTGWKSGAVYLVADESGIVRTDVPYFTATIFDAPAGAQLEVEIEWNESLGEMPALVYSGRALSLSIAVGVVMALIGEAILSEYGLRPNPFDSDPTNEEPVTPSGIPAVTPDADGPRCGSEFLSTSPGNSHGWSICGKPATHAAELEFDGERQTIYSCDHHSGESIGGRYVMVTRPWSTLGDFLRDI